MLAVVTPAVSGQVGAGDDTVKVTATIEPTLLSVGEKAIYRIVITGKATLEELPNIKAPDALEFGSPSRRKDVNIVNGKVSVRGALSYVMRPSEAGDFEIPAQILNVDGKRYTTNRVNLTVKPGRKSGSASQPAPVTPPSGKKMGNASDSQEKENDLRPFLRMEVGKTRFYVGEIVPLSITLFTHSATPLRNVGAPSLDRANFVLREFPRRPVMQVAEAKGATYYASTYPSSLSGIRPGNVTLGPASVECILQIPDQRFGLHPFLNFGSTKRFRVSGEAIELTVLPLPTEGRPAGFGGLVGQFSLSAEATPTQLAVGDPVSLTLTLQGRGNLDEVTPPEMAESGGWKTYPPSVLGESGGDAHGDRRISFNQVLIPMSVQEQIPLFSVPYFDPVAKKYIVLQSDPIKIEVSEAASPGLGAGGGGTVSSNDSGVHPARPVATLTDIVEYGGLGLAVAPPHAGSPPHLRSWFFIWQVIPAFLLLVFLLGSLRTGVSSLMKRKRDAEGEVRRGIAQLRDFRGDFRDFLSLAAGLARKMDASYGGEATRSIISEYETLQFGESDNAAEKRPIDDGEKQKVIALLEKAAADGANEGKAS